MTDETQPTPFMETRLTIVDEYSRRINGSTRRLLQVRCQCGTIKEIHKANLKRTLSCGCLQQAKRTKHGQYQSITYKSWQSMLNRCRNSANPVYSYYGGRGIKVCKRWQTFENFLADMGDRPSVSYSIDRIDNNGNYEPSNCRWATRSEQALNTRQNRILTIDGVSLSVTEWAEKSGLARRLIYNRLFIGWSPESAVKASLYQRKGIVRI